LAGFGQRPIEGGLIHEIAGLLVRGNEGIHFASQRFVAGAGSIQKGAAIFRL
jgi:hypothetical protein